MCTIMAYPSMDHHRRIPRFSSKKHVYEGVPLGDSESDNRSQMIRARFVMAGYGTESGNCGHHGTTCEENCQRQCCPMHKSEDIVEYVLEGSTYYLEILRRKYLLDTRRFQL